MNDNDNELKLMNEMRAKGKTYSEIAHKINRSINYVHSRVHTKKKTTKERQQEIEKINNLYLKNTNITEIANIMNKSTTYILTRINDKNRKRKQKNTENEIKQINKLRLKGKTFHQIAKQLNKPISSIYSQVNVEKPKLNIPSTFHESISTGGFRPFMKEHFKFKCQKCGLKGISLDLHHRFVEIEPFKKVLIITLLCKSCHNKSNKTKYKIKYIEDFNSKNSPATVKKPKVKKRD